MKEMVGRLHFTPVHPLHLSFNKIVAEREQRASHLPGVTRTETLYIDTRGRLRVMVCFRQGGNIDDSRTYDAHLAESGSFGDPHTASSSLEEIGRLCEDLHLLVLGEVFATKPPDTDA